MPTVAISIQLGLLLRLVTTSMSLRRSYDSADIDVLVAETTFSSIWMCVRAGSPLDLMLLRKYSKRRSQPEEDDLEQSHGHFASFVLEESLGLHESKTFIVSKQKYTSRHSYTFVIEAEKIAIIPARRGGLLAGVPGAGLLTSKRMKVQ